MREVPDGDGDDRFVLEKRGRFRVPRKKWAEWLNTTEDVACHIVDLFAVSEGYGVRGAPSLPGAMSLTADAV